VVGSSSSSSVRIVVRSVEDVSLLPEVFDGVDGVDGVDDVDDVDDEEGPSMSVVSGGLVLVIV
jgi:hypothetical protein